MCMYLRKPKVPTQLKLDSQSSCYLHVERIVFNTRLSSKPTNCDFSKKLILPTTQRYTSSKLIPIYNNIFSSISYSNKIFTIHLGTMLSTELSFVNKYCHHNMHFTCISYDITFREWLSLVWVWTDLPIFKTLNFGGEKPKVL